MKLNLFVVFILSLITISIYLSRVWTNLSVKNITLLWLFMVGGSHKPVNFILLKNFTI